VIQNWLGSLQHIACDVRTRASESLASTQLSGEWDGADGDGSFPDGDLPIRAARAGIQRAARGEFQPTIHGGVSWGVTADIIYWSFAFG
jgi:hypothetical protein